MPTNTVWNDNSQTHYSASADYDSLTVLPGVYAYTSVSYTDTVDLYYGAKVINFGSLINASSSGYNTIYATVSNATAFTVENYGLISRIGDTTDGSAAIRVESGPGYITNYGTITSARTAIYASSSYAYASTNIENHGTIQVTNGYYAIVADDVSSLRVENSGLIRGSIQRFGGGASGDTVLNLPGGLMLNDVVLGSGPNVVTNEGDIQGYVSVGSGADVVTNTGTIRGSLYLGGGANTLKNYGVVYGDVVGGSGVDTIDMTYGYVVGHVSGGLGADLITGGSRNDVMYGDNETGDTTGGNDTLYGGYGDDVLSGGYGNDALYGNQDNDILYGNQGDDWMHGGQGNDFLYGGQGNDTINGGVGDDILFGNLGDDLFAFGGPGFGHDVIYDFSRVSGNMDRIQFGAGVFASFADLQAHMTQMPSGVLISDASGDTVLIIGATVGALTADIFTIG